MEINILGSGTATPSLARNASGLVIRAGEAWILVDIGPGTLRRMCEAGVNAKWVDFIVLTHFHADHVSDLAPFLFASNYEYGQIRKTPFALIGPAGTEQFYQRLVKAYGSSIVPMGERLQISELSAVGADVFTSSSFTLRSIPSAHTFPSLSYRIEADGASVTVSGDTDFSANLIELARETDLFVCESSFPDGMKVAGHLVPSEAGRIADAARVKKLVLTHLYPPCDEADIVGQASEAYAGEIIKAHDLMTLMVRRTSDPATRGRSW